jgi:hypothetical protein
MQMLVYTICRLKNHAFRNDFHAKQVAHTVPSNAPLMSSKKDTGKRKLNRGVFTPCILQTRIVLGLAH